MKSSENTTYGTGNNPIAMDTTKIHRNVTGRNSTDVISTPLWYIKANTPIIKELKVAQAADSISNFRRPIRSTSSVELYVPTTWKMPTAIPDNDGSSFAPDLSRIIVVYVTTLKLPQNIKKAPRAKPRSKGFNMCHWSVFKNYINLIQFWSWKILTYNFQFIPKRRAIFPTVLDHIAQVLDVFWNICLIDWFAIVAQTIENKCIFCFL